MYTEPTNNNQLNQEDTMMQCDKVWDLLSVYADGEASPQEAAIVEAHVAVCPDCARDLQFMQGTQEVLRDVPEVEPPAMLRSAILAATVNRPSLPERLAIGVRKTLAPAPVRYGALAAAGAAAALTAVMLHEGGGPVQNIPLNPPIVASTPAKPGNAPAFGAGTPDVDLIDVYEPATPQQARTVAQHRSGSRPVLRVAQRPEAPAKRTQAGSAARSRDKATVTAAVPTETPGSDDLMNNNGAPAVASAPKVVDPEPVTRLVASSAGAEMDEADASASRPGSAGSARIVLAASAVSLDPQQVATLADLRRSLSHGETSNAASLIPTRPHDKQIRVDVIRSSF